MTAVKADVMRIATASYYVGRGEYELFVRNSDKEIVKRKVQLGDSNFEFVEVVTCKIFGIFSPVLPLEYRYHYQQSEHKQKIHIK